MRAAFYECDVTPPLGGFQWGHYKEAFAEEVHTRLYAKACVIEDNGEYAAFVVIDSCALPIDLHDVVTKRVYEYTGITADKICVAATHSHSGVPASDSPEIGCLGDRAYMDVLFRLCADAIILAYRRLNDVNVSFSNTEVKGACFNRNYLRQDGLYKTQPGPDIVKPLDGVDESLPALIFECDGKPIGAIISYALHPCLTREEIRGYSGDYPAILSEKLKEKYGDDFVSLFLVGTCGDVNHLNPDPTAERYHYKNWGPILANAFVDSQNERQPVCGGVKAVKEYVRVPRRSNDIELNRDRLEYNLNTNNLMNTRNLLYYISKKQPEYTDLAVQCIKIGDTLIACLPGEIYMTYGRRIKAESPFKNTIVIENSNTYCGYIPSIEAFNPEKNRLYETNLCYHSCHIPEAGNMLCDKLLELANSIK